jgi:hypothetical protein
MKHPGIMMLLWFALLTFNIWLCVTAFFDSNAIVMLLSSTSVIFCLIEINFGLKELYEEG